MQYEYMIALDTKAGLNTIQLAGYSVTAPMHLLGGRHLGQPAGSFEKRWTRLGPGSLFMANHEMQQSGMFYTSR
jgi:hypothetical protein